MTQALVFCEQCGGRMTATAKHCRACGAEQEMLELDVTGEGGAEKTGPGAAYSVEPPGKGHLGPVQPPVTPRTPGLGATVYPRVARATAKARRFGEDTLKSRAATSFPGRSLSDIALAAIGGGLLAFAAACVLAWGLLVAFVEQEGLPLFQLARLAVPGALGAPLTVEAQVIGTAAEAEVQLPITSFILVPLASVVFAGFLAARWFHPRDHAEAWKFGALVGVSFSAVLTLLSSAFATDLSLPAALLDLSGDDSSLFDLSDAGSSASVAIRASALQTAMFGCLWGVPGGVIGAGLYGRSGFGAQGLARLARTRATGAPLVAVEGAVRAFGFALVALGALVGLLGLVGTALESDIRGLLVLMLAAPTAALASVFVVQGIGYQAEGLLLGLSDELAFPTGTTFHLWDTTEGMFLLVGTAVVAYALARGGRRAAHAVGGADVRGFVRAGASIAIPWVALLLLVRPLASAEVTASGIGTLEGLGSIAPAFGETILLGGAVAVLAGAGGGWIAWRERLSPDTTLLTRAFGKVEGGMVSEPDRVLPPVPLPHGSPPEPAQVPSRWSFCDQCGHSADGTDRFCEGCGHALQPAGI